MPHLEIGYLNQTLVTGMFPSKLGPWAAKSDAWTTLSVSQTEYQDVKVPSQEQLQAIGVGYGGPGLQGSDHKLWPEGKQGWDWNGNGREEGKDHRRHHESQNILLPFSGYHQGFAHFLLTGQDFTSKWENLSDMHTAPLRTHQRLEPVWCKVVSSDIEDKQPRLHKWDSSSKTKSLSPRNEQKEQ